MNSIGIIQNEIKACVCGNERGILHIRVRVRKGHRNTGRKIAHFDVLKFIAIPSLDGVDVGIAAVQYITGRERERQ